MTMDFRYSSLADVPFIALLNDTDPHPLLLPAILPGMNLVILRGQPGERTPLVTDDDLRAAAFRAMELAVEESEKEVGAGIKSVDCYHLFVFRSEWQDAVLEQMGCETMIPYDPSHLLNVPR